MLHQALALIATDASDEGGASGLAESLGAAADAELVCRVAEGDRAAMRIVYERFGSRIHRFSRDLCGGDAAAWDATQETFARAFTSIGSLRNGARLGPFLFGIARNVSREQRKASRRDDRIGSEALSRGAVERLNPESIALGREALGIVERALAGLPDDRRAALLMRVDHHLSYDEIAESFGWSLAKAKIEVFRGREILRSILEREGAGR